jgi:hypothetical protein
VVNDTLFVLKYKLFQFFYVYCFNDYTFRHSIKLYLYVYLYYLISNYQLNLHYRNLGNPRWLRTDGN